MLKTVLIAQGWLEDDPLCVTVTAPMISVYIYIWPMFLLTFYQITLLSDKKPDHMTSKGDYSVVLMFKHSADTHNIHWIISHSKCRFRSYCTWTGTSSKGLLGPEETYRWSFDSTATLQLHTGNPAEQRGWAAGCHNTQEVRHGEHTPGAQQDRQHSLRGRWERGQRWGHQQTE